jgi:signal transduction histidine kinase
MRRTLGWPILLAIVMIVLLVALTVGWVVLSVKQALDATQFAGLYWTLLAVGSVFLILVITGVVMYLILTIKAINLNQRQSNFIDSVTHELKSPIASLKLYLQTLNRRQVTEEQQADFYRFMLADVERLDQLINHMLDAARLEQEPTEDEGVGPVEVAGILEHCAKTATMRYHVAPETVKLDLEPAWVRGRQVDVDMIFRNLLDNAVKYAGNEPKVEVSLRLTRAGQVLVKISDNGRGIPAKLRWKIFRRFVRLGRELERDKPGTGLGLYIVRTLVKRLGGKITVRDPEAGPGTVFEVQLPGEAAPPAKIAA